jgi:hypothetical protein
MDLYRGRVIGDHVVWLDDWGEGQVSDVGADGEWIRVEIIAGDNALHLRITLEEVESILQAWQRVQTAQGRTDPEQPPEPPPAAEPDVPGP